MTEYYVDIEGQTAGPFDLAEVKKLYHAGTIGPETIYTTPKSVDWFRVALLIPLLADAPARIEKSNRPLARRDDWICEGCGTIGQPQKKTKGSFLVEVFLWVLFCAPGLIYSLWRVTGRENCCPQCQGTRVFPAMSPRGAQLVDFDASRDWIAGFGHWCGLQCRAFINWCRDIKLRRALRIEAGKNQALLPSAPDEEA